MSVSLSVFVNDNQSPIEIICASAAPRLERLHCGDEEAEKIRFSDSRKTGNPMEI
jgi:hypothetical protein